MGKYAKRDESGNIISRPGKKRFSDAIPIPDPELEVQQQKQQEEAKENGTTN